MNVTIRQATLKAILGGTLAMALTGPSEARAQAPPPGPTIMVSSAPVATELYSRPGGGTATRYYYRMESGPSVIGFLRTTSNPQVSHEFSSDYRSYGTATFPNYGANYIPLIFIPPPLPSPEIDPGSAAGALSLLMGGVLMLADRRRTWSA